jgi:serine/threonine protein kinase
MGNSETTGSEPSIEQFMKDYELVSAIKESILGELSVYRHKKTDELVYAKEYSSELVSSWDTISHYVRSGKFKNPMYVTEDAVLAKVQGADRSGMLICPDCGKKERLLVTFKDVTRDLEGEISCRQGENGVLKDHFPEAEVWYILEAILRLEALMQTEGRLHGDIRSTTVFITEDGKIKFIDANIIDANMTNLWKTVFNVYHCPISPEYMQAFNTRSYKASDMNSIDEKSEVWSIGILLLSVCDLAKEDTYYDWSRNEIRFKMIEASLEAVGRRYSPLLYSTLRKSLEVNVHSRAQIKDLALALGQRKSTHQN